MYKPKQYKNQDVIHNQFNEYLGIWVYNKNAMMKGKTMKKGLTICLLVVLLSGCSTSNGGNSLFSFFRGNNPDSVEVRKGDTLYSLSKKYDVPLKRLIAENNLSSPYTLKVGQRLKLPTPKTHTVAKGDTLYSISKKHNVDIASLIELNGLDEPYSINVGQKLDLPKSKGSMLAANNVSTTSNKNNATNKTIRKTTASNNVSTNRKSKFIWPVNGSVVSNFGVVGKGRRNDGINIKAATGTNVKAADKGVVAYAGNELKGFGNLVLIKHSDGYITAYAHNDQLYVKKGQTVLKGEKIATVGSTGSVNTPQLHFEVRAGKKAVNPRAYLP